jgi:hypothetical protein
MMRRRQTRPVDERKAPFSVDLDIGNTLHHTYVANAKDTWGEDLASSVLGNHHQA